MANLLTRVPKRAQFRNLWEHIRLDMPRAGRGNAVNLDPMDLPAPFPNAAGNEALPEPNMLDAAADQHQKG